MSFHEEIKIDFDVATEMVKAIGKKTVRNFIIDEHNVALYRDLIGYFLNKESKRYNLNKGIVISGSVGTGKTAIFNIFKIFTNVIKENTFKKATTKEIISNYVKNGFEGIEPYGYNCVGTDNINRNPMELLIDDFGYDIMNAKHFGNEVDVMGVLLEYRYDILINYNKRIHATTNFTKKELSNMFGERLESRFKEMFNYFELRGKDRRK